ncbi:MAG TPA: Smr/MutS family protein, partial [Chroococcales cyanobacterium]
IGILEKVNHRSLVLLDEVGAGTDPSEGVVLARAILETLQERGAKTVASTHFGELKRLAFSVPGFENASVEFNNETLSPTFRLLMGVPGQSNAINIAKRLGLPLEVVLRALELAEHGNQESARLIQHLEEEKIQAILARREAEEARARASRLEAEFEKKNEAWQQEKARLREKALVEIASELKNAKEEISSTIRELQSSRSGQAAEKAQSKMSKILQRIQAQEKKPKPVKKELAVGDLVFLEKLGQNAAIVTLPDMAGNLSLAIGPMKISANLKEISPLKESLGGPKKMSKMREAVLSPTPVYSGRQATLSCDLRGRITEDALFELEQYLDTVYGAEVKSVTVIHGAGTGVLRKRIREYLKDSPYVASFRPGEIGEGGDGVTVVDLR